MIVPNDYNLIETKCITMDAILHEYNKANLIQIKHGEKAFDIRNKFNFRLSILKKQIFMSSFKQVDIQILKISCCYQKGHYHPKHTASHAL